MISVIICSADSTILGNVKKNIGETIGVPYEIIAIDNSDGQYGICRAYNEGAAKAKHPVLCFMHEDISFETKNWGLLVCHHLADEESGLLGLAGGDAKSLVPSSWSIPVVSNEINLVQHYKFIKAPPERFVVTNPNVQGTRKKVVSLDGVWLCTKRVVFDQFQFDEATFIGFHGYDIDYSLQVNTRYNVYVIFDIVVNHFSEGRPDKKWINSAVLLSRKWKTNLPVSIYNLPEAAYNLHHWQSLQVFLQRLFQLNYQFPFIVYYLFLYSFNRFFSVRRFLSMSKYITTAAFSKLSIK